jgi:hypothetical protein
MNPRYAADDDRLIGDAELASNSLAQRRVRSVPLHIESILDDLPPLGPVPEGAMK